MRTSFASALLIATVSLGGVAQARHHRDKQPASTAPASASPSSLTSDESAPPVAPEPPGPPPAPAAPPTAPAAPPPPAAPPDRMTQAEAGTPSPNAAAASTSARVEPGAAEAQDECALPAWVTAADPIRSGVVPGAAGEFAPPMLDVVGASVAGNVNGVAMDAVVAPAGIGTTKHVPVVSDLRMQLYARQNFQRLGGALKLGWDSGSAKLVDGKADRSPGACTPAKRRELLAARFDRVNHHRIVIGLTGAAELLPVASGPKVEDPTSHALIDPSTDRFGGYRGTLHIGYFANRSFGLWAVGGIAGSRALHGTRGVNMRAGGGLDLAYQLGLGALRDDGFQPGITFGAFGRYGKCLTDGGCDENVHGYDAPVAFDAVISAGAYLGFRLSNLVQLRLAVPTNYYVLKSAPAGTAGGANIVEVIPTIAISVASWGL